MILIKMSRYTFLSALICIYEFLFYTGCSLLLKNVNIFSCILYFHTHFNAYVSASILFPFPPYLNIVCFRPINVSNVIFSLPVVLAMF